MELKATVRQLATELEAMLDDPARVPETPVPAPSTAIKRPRTRAAPKPTHAGTVLGLKGKDDYEALLVREGPNRMTDQHGRSFDLGDYGYDADESYRLDLSSLREI